MLLNLLEKLTKKLKRKHTLNALRYMKHRGRRHKLEEIVQMWDG